MSTLQERLISLRGENSREDFAPGIDVKATTWRNYETGASLPNFETIVAICKKLSISSEWLLFGTGPMRLGDSPEMPDQPQPALPAGSPCERCAKLETELEEERRERRELTVENRELTTENRQLWKENGDLRERCARLEGQGALDACLPFKKLPNTQSSDRANS